MSNIVLAAPTLSDAGTITGSESVGDMTIGNLQKRSLKRMFRTLTLSGIEINIDLGSAQEIDLIALIGHNGTSGATVTVQAGSTDAVSDYTSGSLSLISGTDIGLDENLFTLLLGTSQTYRYWKLTISDASNPAGYFQAGRLYLSKAFQPGINIDYGTAEGFIDNSKTTRTTNGEPVPLRREPYRFAEFTLSFGTEAEMYGTLYDIDRLRGTSKDVLYINDPAATTHFQRRFVYGLMSEMNPTINRLYELFQKKYRIEEIPS